MAADRPQDYGKGTGGVDCWVVVPGGWDPQDNKSIGVLAEKAICYVVMAYTVQRSCKAWFLESVLSWVLEPTLQFLLKEP